MSRYRYQYTFKKLKQILKEKLDYNHELEYSKYHVYYLTNLDTNSIVECFESRADLEEYIFSL